MFAYCNNNPIIAADYSGQSVWRLYIGDEGSEGDVDDGISLTCVFSESSSPNTYGAGNTPSNVVQTGAGSIAYPPNLGFLYSDFEILDPGSIIQRTGGLHVRFVASAGTPAEMLSLPPDQIGQPTTYLKVNEGCYVAVISGPAIPWFEQPGLGKQFYLLQGSVEDLIDRNTLSFFSED